MRLEVVMLLGALYGKPATLLMVLSILIKRYKNIVIITSFEVGRRTGGDVFEKYAKLFGLGAKTGVELTGEASGTISGPTYKGKLYEKVLIII